MKDMILSHTLCEDTEADCELNGRPPDRSSRRIATSDDGHGGQGSIALKYHMQYKLLNAADVAFIPVKEELANAAEGGSGGSEGLPGGDGG
jgi:hypothetical protein